MPESEDEREAPASSPDHLARIKDAVSSDLNPHPQRSIPTGPARWLLRGSWRTVEVISAVVALAFVYRQVDLAAEQNDITREELSQTREQLRLQMEQNEIQERSRLIAVLTDCAQVRDRSELASLGIDDPVPCDPVASQRNRSDAVLALLHMERMPGRKIPPDLSFLQLQYCMLNDANMARVRLDFSDLSRAHFENANLVEARMLRVIANGATFANADLSRAYLRFAKMSANLRGAKLDSAELRGAKLDHTDIADASFRGANLNEVDLTLTNTMNVDFSNANLKDALVADWQLKLCRFSNTTCPDGTNSDSNGATCVGHSLRR